MVDPEIAKRNARARRTGKTFEADLLKTLRAAGLDIERSRDTGTKDEGDHIIRMPDGTFIVVEAKAEAKYNISSYVTEARQERLHFIEHRPHLKPEQVKSIAVMKARGKPILDAYVVTTLRDYFGIEEPANG